jgi:hypothetical protein
MASTIYVGLAVTGQGGNHNTSTFDHLSITGTQGPLPPSVVELTDGGFGEAGGAFLNNRVGVQNFTTTFTFQITPGTTPTADGMAFVIQGDGPTALGPPGGGLGYGSDTLGAGGGLPRSLAIKFDLYSNAGEGVNSTGIFTDGRSPTVRQPGLSAGFPDTSIDLTGTGIDLHSGDAFRVDLGYDGTTLTETITDTVTSATFTTTYVVNIPVLVGSDAGYMGFTGGTGGLTAVQDVLSWTVQTTISGRPIGDSPDGGGGVSPTAAVGPGSGGGSAVSPLSMALAGMDPSLGSGIVGANRASTGAATLGQLIGIGGPAASLPGPMAAAGLVGGSPTPLGTSAGAGDGYGLSRPPSRSHAGVDVGALDQVFSSSDLWEVLPGGPR